MTGEETRVAGETVLIVDDDRELVQVLTDYLRSEGYRVLAAHDGPQALKTWREARPDLILLDWMLPGTSGLDVCREIRQTDRGVFIVMLTARGEEPDKLLGLELGADDYVTKPFSLREVAARIRAVLRRGRRGEEPDVAEFGDVVIDFSGHVVSVGGREVALTPTEFKLLSVLARSPGRVFSRLQLMEAALGDYYEGYDRTIDSHISHLRRKLDPDGRGTSLIQTVQGVGYKLVPPGR